MSQPLYLAFIWHMHQPYYRDLVTGACSMPWVRLHATKDYLDMVKILEPFPNIHQTFNLVPSLLDQLESYLPPSNQSDAYLEVSRRRADELSEAEQRFILQWFFLANVERMIKPHPRYHDLLAKRGMHFREEDWPELKKRFKTQDYLDLQVWFNLTWIDPWLRSQDAQLMRLEAKGAQFSEEEKHYVLDRHLTLIAEVIPAYREAAKRGQIELTTSPYYHPIMPLLCDLRSVHMALPHLTLPEVKFKHPEDARWHLEEALSRHERAFGERPQGVWPPEGSVSEEAVKLAMDLGVRWIATDEEILWRTLKQPRSASMLYRPHLLRRKAGQAAIVFRDRELSDLIGFVYSQWDPIVAVSDFLERLAEIHEQFRSAAHPALASIILDGENAWESYPNDGYPFLHELYRRLAADERFRCVTVSEFLKQFPVDQAESLPDLFSGSWIDGNFATWIGHPEKNIAWSHLSKARQDLAHLDRRTEVHHRAWSSLAIAEGSDWMWWFGDTHFSAHAYEFDALFRTHLTNAYRQAGMEPPQALQQPIRRKTVVLAHHPTGLTQPTLDGRATSYYEWLYAGRIDLLRQYGAMHRAEQCLRDFYYGFDQTRCYFRIDLDTVALAAHAPWTLELATPHGVCARITAAQDLQARATRPATCALDRLLEVAVPATSLQHAQGATLALTIRLFYGEREVERYPEHGAFELITSLEGLEAHAWSV